MSSTRAPGLAIGAIAGLAVTVLFILSLIFGSWFVITESERGILLRNGKYVGIEKPGLGFKWPFFDSIQRISMQTYTQSYKDLHTYSRDQQSAVIRMSVTYHATEVGLRDLYTNFLNIENYVSRIIDPKVFEEMKTVFGRFSAAAAIQERGRLNAEIRAAITEATKGAVTVTNVQVENIDFSKAYENSIEQRMLAEVEVQKIRQNAEREKIEAEIVVIKAKAEADRVTAIAGAQATQIKLKGNAEAETIRARGLALADSPRLIELVQAERWNGVLPTTVLPTTAVPIINGAALPKGP